VNSDDTGRALSGLDGRTVAVEAAGAGYAAGGRQLLTAASMTVRRGELVVIIGPNGAGKSTLLALLAGDLRPTRGSIRLLGQPAHASPETLARHRAVLPQDPQVSFDFTVADVVQLGRTPYPRSAGGDFEAAARAMETAGVGHLAARTAGTLSGGERALVALARVLAQETPVLLLDEPTAALDIRHQHAVLAAARRRALAGDAVIVVLHDLAIAAAYADRIVLLSDGRIAADGPPADIFREDLISTVFAHPVTVIPHPADGYPSVLSRRLPLPALERTSLGGTPPCQS
jgi:iron complex transport system ATP-binding protein